MIREPGPLDELLADPAVVAVLQALGGDRTMERSFQREPWRVFEEAPDRKSGLVTPDEVILRMTAAGLVTVNRGAAPWPGKHEGYALRIFLSKAGEEARHQTKDQGRKETL